MDAWSVSATTRWKSLPSHILQSVVHGRPPAMSINHIDCRFPDDLDPFVKPSGEVELGCGY